jgi:TonB family protein
MLPCKFICLILLLLLPGHHSENRCLLHLESPIYHRLARQARIQGEVKVLVKIAPDGKVFSAHATSGHQLLRQEVESNVQKWIFNPGEEQTIEVAYEFRLEEPEVDSEPPSRVSFDLPSRVLVISNFKPIYP